MRVINNIFYRRGLPVLGGRSADILVSSAFDHSAATLAFCSVLTVRRPGRAGSGGRTGRAGRAGRAAEGRGGGFGRSCRAVDGEAGRGGTGRLSRGRRRSCRACCSVRPCRAAAACRMEGPGWLSRVVAQDGGGCVGRSRWAAEVSGGGGHVGRRMERPNGDGPGGVGDLLCRMRAVGACPCPCPCPCPCLPANRMSAAEKRRRNLSLPARKRIFEGH